MFATLGLIMVATYNRCYYGVFLISLIIRNVRDWIIDIWDVIDIY